MKERSLFILKPDCVDRLLTGKVLSIIEDSGLKIIALQMSKPTRELISKHYQDDESWLKTVGNKTIESYQSMGLDVQGKFSTTEPVAIGKVIREWLIDFMTSGNVVAGVVEGNCAPQNLRRLCGETLPINAGPSSIRGKFSCDSPDMANSEGRPVKNLIHASGNSAEAEYEINLWFPNLNA